MKIFPSILCSAMTFLLVCCKKESDPQLQATKTDHLTTSSWKLNSAGIDQDKNGTIDVSVMTIIPPCIVDNTITFKRDNTGVTDEGTSKCNTTDPQTTAFNWSFSDAEASLNISNSVLGQLNGKSKILLLNETSLNLTKDTVVSGFPAAVVVQLIH